MREKSGESGIHSTDPQIENSKKKKILADYTFEEVSIHLFSLTLNSRILGLLKWEFIFHKTSFFFKG